MPAKAAGWANNSMVFWENYDNTPNPEVDDTIKPETDLEWSLKKYGLAPHEVELIQARFVDGLTLVQIVESKGWTSKGSVLFHIRSILKKLKERGFKL